MSSGKACMNKENFNKEAKNFKQNQTEILELKNKITDLKNSVEGSILDQSKKKRESTNLRTNYLKLFSWKRKSKSISKNEESLRELLDTIK